MMLLCVAFLFTSCAEDRQQGAERVESFPLQEVRLLDGPFKHACDLDVKVLLQYDTDRMLAPFRREAGLPKKAEVFPNWAGMDGHVSGHYLSALAMAYAATGDEECRRRAEYMLSELAECQKANGDGYVYLTDSGLIDDISYTLLDCVQKEEIPQMASISEVKVVNEDTSDIIYKENAGYCYSDAYMYYLKDGDAYRNLDNVDTGNAFTTLSEFTWTDCVDYYADDTELEYYGLADPAATVTIIYRPAEEDSDDSEDGSDDAEAADDAEDQIFEYEVGKSDNAYYAKLADSNIVYTISEEVYSAAVNASYEKLKPDEVILLDWDTVDSIEMELDGNVYTVDLEKDGDDAYKYTLNGAEVEFDDVLDQILNITVAVDSADDEEDDLPEEEPALSGNKSELKLTFHRNTDEYQTVELEFYQYDGSHCISVLNGDEMNYTDRSPVIDLKEAINSVILDSESGE